jgi:cell volume regulation protein A
VAKGERIPRWARPSLILRDGRSLRPHTAGRVQPDDQVYIVTATGYLPLLDQLFAGPAESAFDPQLYGEFLLDPDATLADVAKAYDTTVDETEAGLTLREFFQQRLHGNVEPGDRVRLGRFDLIVRAVDEAHDVVEVGLGVEPAAAAAPRLSLNWPRLAFLDRLKPRRSRSRLPAEANPTADPEKRHGKPDEPAS